MIATLTIPSLGGGSREVQAPARLNPPPTPHRRLSYYQVQYRTMWFRVEIGDGGAMFFSHASGRIGVVIAEGEG